MAKQKNSINPLVILAVVLLVGFFGYKYFKTTQFNNLKNNILPKALKKAINNDQAKFTIGAIKEVSGLYEFDLTVNGQKYTSYLSKDGKILFPSAIKLDATPAPGANQAAEAQPKKLSCADVKKAKEANLTAYVVSQCPYGLQMQKVFKAAIAEQPELAKSLSIKYIGSIENGKITSMHGDQEAQENLRQICIREEQKDLYWPYVSCYMQEGKSEQCLTSTGVDTNALTNCVTDKNKGLKYAQVDFNSANKFNVSGSPTLLINNKQIVSEFDFGGRVANSIKELVCCGSETQSAYCSTKLSTDEMAVAFSQTDKPSATTNTGNTNANCGN